MTTVVIEPDRKAHGELIDVYHICMLTCADVPRALAVAPSVSFMESTIFVGVIILLLAALSTFSRTVRIANKLIALLLVFAAAGIGYFYYASYARAALLPFMTYRELREQSLNCEQTWNLVEKLMCDGPLPTRKAMLEATPNWLDKAWSFATYTDFHAAYSTALYDAQWIDDRMRVSWRDGFRVAEEHCNAPSTIQTRRITQGMLEFHRQMSPPPNQAEIKRREQLDKLKLKYDQAARDLSWPLYQTAALEALRAAPLRHGPGGIPEPSDGGLIHRTHYRETLTQLRKTPLGLDPILERELLEKTWFFEPLPGPDLKDTPAFEPMAPCSGITVVSLNSPLSETHRKQLDQSTGGQWCQLVVTKDSLPQPAKGIFAIRLDAATYHAPVANPLTRAALEAIPFTLTGERDRIRRKLDAWDKIREERARSAGSENNWVWMELLSRHTLVFKKGRVVSMAETAMQAVMAAPDLLRNSSY